MFNPNIFSQLKNHKKTIPDGSIPIFHIHVHFLKDNSSPKKNNRTFQASASMGLDGPRQGMAWASSCPTTLRSSLLRWVRSCPWDRPRHGESNGQGIWRPLRPFSGTWEVEQVQSIEYIPISQKNLLKLHRKKSQAGRNGGEFHRLLCTWSLTLMGVFSWCWASQSLAELRGFVGGYPQLDGLFRWFRKVENQLAWCQVVPLF